MSKKLLFIGIDPGMSGGIAVLTRSGDVALLKPLSITVQELWDLLRPYRKRLNTPQRFCAVIEKVHAMPGRSSVSLFKLGAAFGGQRMALVGNRIPFEEVSPQKWQKFFGLKRERGKNQTAWKNQLKDLAKELFPDIKITLKTADALLIAEYNRRVSLSL